ncbi:unnamed protein product [Callosobruchus maculatus]|uniref:Chorein N-terminal domain-containing protein n=1 Tax=Callosobruchus maculatus TaxID=64391 RepID=A0A653BN33_CALMS|nr:unnamed protein product [Callosobruchus maculatus]
MFKLESYITPILLSYVNRYISNLKPEDSQVSLWGGDATFHNLELNLQVLEQELQLPFSFVSGSIRELCIHVPWTKLTSEPITITINTIECILNLKGKNPTSDASAQAKINKTKKPVGKDVEAPQGYVQLLINKIVSNIRIHCNNLILKYVEEDIVLSMNVKHLKYQSANKKWEAAYTDLSPTERTLRKIITVNDLTLCLDKRNASGKIEVYQEPMLYRCSMTMHLLKHYHSTSAKRASKTRLDIYCNKLLMLLYALQQKKLKPEKQTDGQGTSDSSGAIDDSEIKESWTGWAWSYVSAVLPAPWEEEDNTEDLEHPGGHTLHLCIYVDTASVTFKVSESSGVERGTLYPQKKMRYNPMLVLKLQGLYTETVIHGMKWFNAMGGIGQAVLLPVGPCSCGEVEITDEKHPSNYLEIDSLFDGNAEENKGNKRKYNRSWDYHMTVFTEAVLLERTPAFAFDYLYQLEVTIECQFLDVTITYPMYANRVVHATCQLPDAPKKLFDACFTRKTVKVVGLCSRLLIGRKHTTILTPSSLSYCCNAILLPHYWMNPNIPHNEITFESESVTLNATNAKMMVIVTIISKLIMMDCFPYMELYIEGIRYKRVVTNATTSMDMSLGSIKAFIFEKVDASSAVKSKKTIASEDIQQVLFLSGPEAKSGESTATATASRTKLKNKRGTEETPLLTVTFQYPLSPENQKHAPILLFNLQEIRICVDPLLCKWLLYHPRQIVKAGKSDFQLMKKISKPAPPLTTNATSASEASGGGGGGALDTPRRLVGVSSQSVHSSLDREPIRGGGGPPPPSSTGSAHGRKEEPAPHVDLQEKVYNVLRKWFEVWKGVYLCGDVSQCTVYFPLVSLSAEAVELAVNKEQPPELMVITLPFATVRSSHRHQQQQQQQHQEIKKYLRTLPVTVPDHVWTPKSSSLPWTVHVADLSCYTVQHGNKLTFLKPVDSVSGGGGGASGGGGGAGPSRGGKTKGSDIGYLGICVHIDMTPILVSTSEVQVYLFASILYGLMEVATNLMPKRRERVGGGAAVSGLPPKMADVIPSQMAANNGKSGSSAVSPSTAHKDHTFLDSNSDKSSSLSAAKKKPDATAATTPDSDHIKLTAWVQWTITRSGSKWKPGPFSGTVMRLREDVPSSSSGEQQQQERHDDQGGGGVGGNGGGGGFICVTITRASCQHTHTLWGAGVGAAQHAPKRTDRKAATAPPDVTAAAAAAAMLPPSNFYLVLAPLLEIPLSSSSSLASSSESVPLTSAVQASPSAVLLQTVNSQALPLAYLDCRHIRLVMPSVELGATGAGVGAQHDVIIFQVEKISLASSAVNPICRTPIRQDIYDQAVHARILNIPDRQYQLDVCGMRIATGTWQDMDAVFSPSGSVASPLHSLSENPAVEWNNLDSRGAHPCFRQPPSSIMNLWNVTERFDISVVAAPAILYRSHVIVCGHSLEINFVSDIVVNLSLNQIKLVSAILSEFVSLVEPLLLDDSAIARPKIIFPYSRFEPSLDEIDEWEAAVGAGAAMVGVADSGIDTSDIRSVYTAAPVDVLFTAGKIGLSLYQIDDDDGDVGEEARPPPSLYKQHRKKKRPSSYRVDHDLDLDDDKGYDAEEESAEDGPPKMYKPLVFVMVKQPNVFVSKQAAGRRMQVSWYDVNVKLRGPEYLPVGNVPTEDDYPIGLLETRCGQPHPNTGILPAFFTLKYVKPANNKQGGAHLDVEIAKPTKLLCSMSTWSYLLIIRDRLVDTFKRTDKSIAAAKKRENDDVSGISHAKRKAGMNSKFQELKETLRSVNSANLRCGQIVFEFKSDAGHEVNLALEKITANLTLFNRPEKVSVVCGLHSVTLNVVSDRFRKILLNPWTVTCDVAMFWESWQTAESNPQIQVSVESECIMLDVSPEQIRCVQSVLKDVAEFASSFRAPEEEEDRANGRRSGSSRPVSPPLPAKKGNVAAAVAADKEQHYKDDLRAGAFQFVDANTDNVQELPMPYQVAFWNKASLCAMAWRYPQPRALTKVRVFPVPYKTGSGSSSQEDLLVLCHLEYWSECRSCYLPYTHFYLSESEVCHLTLPEATPKTVVGSTWRVVITTTTATGATETDGEQKQSEQQRRQQRRRPSTNSETAHAHAQALISPRALAACMRVDSYFDRSLVPNVTAALYLTKIELALYTHFDKQMPIKLPDCLKTYTPDFLFPDTQRFLSVVLENLTAYSVCWDRDVLTVEVSAALKCNVLDYMYLTEQSLVDPFTFKMDVSLAADALNCNLICKPIQIKVGPTVGHTLAVSSQLWSQSCRQQQQHQQQEQENEGGRRELVVMTRYVVCNDTNVAVRFGQTGTDEAILLPSRCFHLYAWRSQRNKEHLKLALDDHGWTRSFSVARDAVHTVTVDSDNSLTVIVTVKSLSATQKQVIFSGQLIVSNTLLEHFDLKVVEEVPKDSKESEFKNSPTYVVAGKSNTCSIFVNNRKNYFLRLRFYGLDSAWTGDIPLREHATGSQPWLERGQFLSIWCRVIVQEVNRAKRTLAVLWPLFSVKSNLPISSNVHIETPTLNVHLDSLVKGRGELQQLYCPGTIDHSHQLTFRIDPYVPLNYSLVDHQQFFKKPELEEGATIEDILKELSGGGESTASWPYFGDELDDVDWIVGEQPLTHVQVKYQASCRYSCSLLVELVPWCLTVNTLGVPITINVGAGAAATDAVQLCKIPHYGIVAPPKLEENFNIGVCSGGTWCYTEPLQLAKSDWSQSFYMPKFTGTIPLEGCVRSAIVCDGHVCMLSLASTINNDIRLLKVSSTHVLSNHMAMQVQVICLAVPDEEGKFDIPVNMDRYCFTVAPHLDKSKCGISVIRWHTLTNSGRKSTSRAAGGAGGGGGTNYALYMSFSLGGDHWSCPIRVDKPLLRKSFAVRTGEGCSVPVVLTSQDCKGGSGGPIYLTLHEDDAPQLFIENTTGAALYVAQATGNMERAYYTTPGVSDKFPDLPPAPAAAASSGASGAGGSTAAAASWAASSTAAAASDGFGDRIAIASEPDGPPTDQLRWSNALTLRHDNDQFLRIPYYGDIRVRVANTACTTIVLLESVSQVEISARDIRVRLLMQEITNGSAAATTATAAKKINGTSSEPGAGAGAGRKRAARMDREDCAGVGWSETDVSALSGSAKEMIERPLLVRDGCTSLTFNAFVKSLVLVFVSDVQFDDKEKWELMSLVCDDLVCRAVQVESLKLKITTSDVQLDNQLYARESYDFPVVVVGQVSQEKRHPHRLTTLNVPIDSLIEDCDQNALLVLEFTLETWSVRSVKIIVNPLSCYIEDIYVTRLMEYFNTLTPNVLVMLPKQKSEVKFNVPAGSVCVPEVVSLQCAMLAKPLTVRNVLIAPISLLLSVHSSIKLYIALDQSPLQFGRFERKRLLTTPYRLGHALTMHYLSGAIFGAGWVVSSLELLGSPGGLARAMGTGLRDFVSLPCRGIFVGPMAFLRGITQGSASLMRHITAGTLQSVTKLASSVARNLDRLTLDEEHLKRTEEQRRQRPQGLAQGFMQGLTGLGISLLGAVGGIAHHPLQSMIADGASPRSLAAGVGLGLVGIVTKPLSGAAELVALTGQGLLQGAGWSSLPEPRSYPQAYKVEYAPNSTLKYSWKHGLGVGARMLFALEATSVVDGTVHDAVALILTTDALLVVNLDRDDAVTVFALADLHVVSSSSSPGRSDDPTVLRLKLAKPPPPAPAPPPPPPTTQQQQGQPDKTEEDFPMEMDPVSRARVADYVKSTVSLLNLQDGSVDHSEISISPLSSPGLAQVASDEDATCFTYYVSPQNRNYFVYLMKLAKLQLHNYSFPVLIHVDTWNKLYFTVTICVLEKNSHTLIILLLNGHRETANNNFSNWFAYTCQKYIFSSAE